MRKFMFILPATAILALFCCVAAADDLVVVVNKTNPVTSLTNAQLKKIVLGQQASRSSGKKVNVILRSPGQPDRDGVLRSVCGMSEADYNQFTMHADLNGETLAEPKVLGSAGAIKTSVAANPGAIGFLRKSDVDDSVKAVPVDGLAAGQPGYRVK